MATSEYITVLISREGERHTTPVGIGTHDTLSSLALLVQDRFNVPMASQRLVFHGKVLRSDDDVTNMSDVGIANESVVYLMKPRTPPPPSSATTSTTTTTSSSHDESSHAASRNSAREKEGDDDDDDDDGADDADGEGEEVQSGLRSRKGKSMFDDSGDNDNDVGQGLLEYEREEEFDDVQRDRVPHGDDVEFEIYIKCSGCATFPLQVSSSTTVASLKREIQDNVKAHPSEMTMMYAGKPLSDLSSLSQYNVSKESVISVVVKQATSITLIVKFSTGKVVSIAMESTDTVEDLKLRLSDTPGVEMPSQGIRLFFKQTELVEDTNTLSQYGLSNECVINVVFRKTPSIFLASNDTWWSLLLQSAWGALRALITPVLNTLYQIVRFFGRFLHPLVQIKRLFISFVWRLGSHLKLCFSWLQNTVRPIIHLLATIYHTTWDRIVSVARLVQVVLRSVFNKVSTPCRFLYRIVSSVVRWIWNNPVSFVKTKLGQVMTLCTTVMKRGWNLLTAILSSLQRVTSSIFAIVRRKVSDVAHTLWGYTTSLASNVWRFTTSVASNAWRLTTSVSSAVWRHTSAVASTLWRYTSSTASTLWRYSSTVASALWNKVTTVSSAVWRCTSSTLRHVSSAAKWMWDRSVGVCSVLRRYSSRCVSALWHQTCLGASRLKRLVHNTTHAVINFISPIFSSIWTFSKSVVHTIWDHTCSILTRVWRSFSSVCCTVGRAAESLWKRVLYPIISSVCRNSYNLLYRLLSFVFTKTKNIIHAVFSHISRVASKLWTWVTTFIRYCHSRISAFSRFVWNFTWPRFCTVLSRSYALVKRIVLGIRDALRYLFRKTGDAMYYIYQMLRPHVASLMNGCGRVLRWVGTKLRAGLRAVDRVVDAICRAGFDFFLAHLWPYIRPILLGVRSGLRFFFRTIFRVLTFVFRVILFPYRFFCERISPYRGYHRQGYTLDIRPSVRRNYTPHGVLYEMQDQTEYGIFIRNSSNPPSVCHLKVDGSRVGSFLLPPNAACIITHPSEDMRRFKFVAPEEHAPTGPVLAADGGVIAATDPNIGCIEATFEPTGDTHRPSRRAQRRARKALSSFSSPFAASSAASVADDEWEYNQPAQEQQQQQAAPAAAFLAGETVLGSLSDQRFTGIPAPATDTTRQVVLSVRLVTRV
ncbi:ubiquitin 4 [Pelomyxa schiedti]|nr:ubiquitin 4 [Pelomyxa schiedti]